MVQEESSQQIYVKETLEKYRVKPIEYFFLGKVKVFKAERKRIAILLITGKAIVWEKMT
jgi:hypothetical protein